VRYDGGHKRDSIVLEMFGADVEWVPVCPEVEVGMGTPREPIQLVARPAGAVSAGERVRLLGVQSGQDWTREMVEWARRRVRELAALDLSGFILKAESPSCGPTSVRVVHGDAVTPSGRGLFAQALVEAMPDLPVEDEARLADPEVREAFLKRAGGRR
jgi:uncharacterized protein YbbK (DUF523 family)